MKKIFTILISILSVVAMNAQWAQLDDAMLEGGRVSNFEKHGSNLFIATEGGIFRSTDNASSWSSAMDGYSTHSLWSDFLCSHSTGIYCYGPGLFYSTDGSLWTELTTTGFPVNSHITDFGEAGNILYAMVEDESNQDIYLYYSTNGISWTQGAYIGNTSTWFDFDLINIHEAMQFVLIDTLLMRTTDGINFDTVDFNGITNPGGGYDRYFKAEPNGNYLYFLDDNNGIFSRYNLTTDVWEDLTANLPAGAMMYLGIGAGDDAIFITAITVVPVMSLDLYRSVDHGASWSLIPNPGLGSLPWLDELTQIGTNEYLGQDPLRDVYHSTDNGSTWVKSNNGFIASRHMSLVGINNNLISFKDQQGVIRSNDFGNTWSYSNGGLTPFLSDLYFVDDLFKFGSSLYIISQDDPMTENSNLYKSTDGGNNWTLLGTEPDSTRITFYGKNASGFIIRLHTDDYMDFSYQLTIDDGATWTNITAPVQALNLERVFGFYGHASEWYIFGRDMSQNNKAYISTNNGTSWTDISTGLDQGDFQVAFENWGDYMERIPIAFNATGQPIIVMARWDLWPYNMQFYRLNGSTWEMITSSGLDQDIYTGNYLMNDNGTWFFAASEGVYKSVNECATWTQVHTNHENLLPGCEKYSIVKINDMIFLGTMNNGIWKTDLSLEVALHEADGKIVIYPNPAADVLNVLNAQGADLSVIDLTGKVLMYEMNIAGPVDISSLAAGVYIARINLDGKTINLKFIRE